MKKSEVALLIECGFTRPSMYKRSVWNKITLIMEFLVNKNVLVRVDGEVKYGTSDGHVPTEDDIKSWADAYLESPFIQHLDELKQLSKQLHLPLTSGELLKAYVNI